MTHSRPYALALLVSLAAPSSACHHDDPPALDSGPIAQDSAASDAGHDAAASDAGRDARASDAGRDAFDESVPVFRHPLSTADHALALQALQIMGSLAAAAPHSYCNDCHTLSRTTLTRWRNLSDAALSPTGCLNDLAVASDTSATAMVDCMRASGGFTTAPVGVFATASTLPWFRYVFQHGADSAAAHASFVDHAGMPPTTYAPMTQAQFDVIAEWFIRGLPEMESILPGDPPPTTCMPSIAAAVATHVSTLATTGWAARNVADGMLMFGCASATSALDCLASVPLASTTTYGADWASVPDGVSGAHLRVLYTTNYESSYWSRASVDGRFVGHGASAAPNLRFIDLQRGVVIGASASFDPSFFPDGSGFMVQGSAHLCEQSVLTAGAPTSLDFTEPGCTSGASIGLYEHLGASLDGADYWAIAGSATYDNGGQSATLSDPVADWGATAGSTITHLLNTGAGFTVGDTMHVAHASEGDAVFSPSFTVMLTRAAGPSGHQIGYVLRRLDVSATSVSTTELGRYCVNGAKPEFSFDERFFVFHHYIGDGDAVALGFTGPTDPAFAAYQTQGGANAYIVELATGAVRRLTNMAPGQYALFPHFRNDGWIYMTVRTAGAVPEHIVASDAALLFH